MGTRSPMTNTLRADHGRIIASPDKRSRAPTFARDRSVPYHQRHRAATGRKADETERARADSPSRAPPATVRGVLRRGTDRSSRAEATASIALWRFSVTVQHGSSTE